MRKELAKGKAVGMATSWARPFIAPVAIQAQVQVLASVQDRCKRIAHHAARDRALAGLSL